jgi:hypothetical protein
VERRSARTVFTPMKPAYPAGQALRRGCAVVFLAVSMIVSGAARAAAGDLLDAVEYYNAALDHYFVTANANEKSLLDAGSFVGWQRTGLGFKVLDPATTVAGVSPVCRFYGLPSAGLDSHFYSASPVECEQVKERFPGVWMLESDNVFLVGLPDPTTGQCQPGTAPIYRAWNARVDSNHRYTTDPNVELAMIARGYIAEGYGPPPLPVAMCAPGTASGPPSCIVGTSVTLTALCDSSVTGYVWSGCTSTGSTCTATSASTGLRAYTVVGTNAAGPSAPAIVDVFWSDPPPAPVCNISATTNSDRPVVGSLAMLTASCGGNPTSYQWTGCSSSTTTCLVRGGAPGPQTYSLVASNAGGPGVPASATVNWQASASSPPGFCGQYPSILYSDVDWASVDVYSYAYSDLPAFAWNGVWVIKFTVAPGAVPGTAGRLSVSEFAGPSTSRDSTLSTVPCDFRATDPSGASGPLSHSNGTTTTNSFVIGSPIVGTPGLQPGQTYYLNVRNFTIEDGTISCPAALQRCDALVNLVP